MANNRFLAKTINQQTIVEHTEDLIDQMNYFLEIYPTILDERMIKMLYTVICYHDIGKVNRRFQNKLYNKLNIETIPLSNTEWEEIPHGYLSPAYLNLSKLGEEFFREEMAIMITAIMEHHSRKDLDNKMKRQLCDMLQQELVEDISEFKFKRLTYLTKKPQRKYIRYRRLIVQRDVLDSTIKRYVVVKGLLNKIDYTASTQLENVKVEEPTLINGRGIADFVEEGISKQFTLRPIQKYLKNNQNSNLIIIASTGIGKTEAALLWIGHHKGYFTLPLKVSINVIYKRVKEQYGYESVELIHSSMANIYLEEDYATNGEINERLQMARLHTKPLIITTIDQIFKFVFLAKGFEFILSTLSYSKVVIDEIQMYDPNILACLIRGMKLIQEYGGKFLVMTATFPRYLRDVMKEHGIQFDQTQEKRFLLDENLVKKRHFSLIVDVSCYYKYIRSTEKVFS